MNQFKNNGPIVIGGVGGSGTRVIAKILKDLGFYLGSTLNDAYDNLFFTLLFKRPQWFVEVSNKNKYEIYKGLEIFEKKMTTHYKPEPNEIEFIMNAAHNFIHGQDLAENIADAMLKTQTLDYSSYIGWGWKEPNSHIYLQYMDKYFKNLKYIHVIRNGLSMAYSNNQQQVHNWGQLFDIQIPNNPEILPKASLNYWIKSNEIVLLYGKQNLKDKFLAINFDELCLNPQIELTKLANFLNIDQSQMNVFIKDIMPPKTLTNYRDKDLSIFDKEEINFVKALGFQIEV